MLTSLLRAEDEAPDPTVDAEAFRALYQREFDFVWNVVRRLGVAERDLPDVVHDVFVVVYRRFSTYDPSRPLRPWLFGIAFRAQASHRRRLREAGRADREPDTLQGDAPAPDERMIERERRALVHTILQGLSPEHRAVLVGHELEGLPMAALSEALDVPVKTLYSRLRAAREEFVAAMRRHALRGAR
ncbi:MAG: sigma-70 family RNA polymerase sigma factor [Polyangiales bacterium]